MMAQQINGVVVSINRARHTITVKSGSDYFVIPGERRIKHAAGNHGCVVQVGDELFFDRPTDNKTIYRAYFTKPPEVQIQPEEISRVSAIENGSVFAARVNPDCGCGILLGWVEEFSDLKVGDLVRHG